MAIILDVLDGNVVFTNNAISNDVKLKNHIVEGDVSTPRGLMAEWGKITGDIDDQTDLIEILDDKADISDIPIIDSSLSTSSNNPVENRAIATAINTIQNDVDVAKYVWIGENRYRIVTQRVETVDGVEWFYLLLDDGTPDGNAVYLADHNTVMAIRQFFNFAIQDVESQIPYNVSQLNNDSGYITGVTSTMVTNALGFTPYNSTNPNGYTSDSALTTADIDEVCV